MTVWDGEKYRKVIVSYDAVIAETIFEKNVRKCGESTKRYTEDKRRQRTKVKSRKRGLNTTIEVNQDLSAKKKIKSIMEISSKDTARKRGRRCGSSIK